jgi:hypothetical protein
MVRRLQWDLSRVNGGGESAIVLTCTAHPLIRANQSYRRRIASKQGRSAPAYWILRMCVGFWSLEHPDYALCVSAVLVREMRVCMNSSNYRLGSFAPIATSFSHARLRPRISTRSSLLKADRRL